MNIVLCENAEKRAYTAGNKARTDTVQILVDAGYKHIPLFRSKSNKVVIILQMLWGITKTFWLAGKGDNVFIQYPYYPEAVNGSLIMLLSFGRIIKQYKICLLIHDSVGLRNNETGLEILSREVKMLNRADNIISHNEKMTQEFQSVRGQKNYYTLGPFDYLYSGDLADCEYEKVPTICVAGNLSQEKCGYLYKIDQIKKCKFNLYGLGYTGVTSENIEYKGAFAPEELIAHLHGSFGLVWDGDSLDTCDGMYGRYLKFNNPHKFSLYMAAGLPVIVWKESALASYVEKFRIGICVNSLYELNDRCISEKQYNILRNNVLSYRRRIIAGEHLKEIVEQF